MKIHADLSMIRVFCGVYETGSVTKAAALVSLSQPATSYLLAQLRAQTGNPLFSRTRGGMTPTPFAVSFYEKIKPALEGIDRTLTSLSVFDPIVSDRIFRVAMSDIGEMMFIPPLLQDTRQSAPDIVIETHSINIGDLERSLSVGHVDFAIGFLPDLNGTMENITLFEERYVCLYGAKNKFLESGVTLEGYLLCSQVEVFSPSSNHHLFDHFLKTQIPRNRVGLRVSHYATVPAALTSSDMVVVLPSRVGNMFLNTHDLRMAELPFDLPQFEVRLYWSSVFASDPGHEWMRDAIVRALARC